LVEYLKERNANAIARLITCGRKQARGIYKDISGLTRSKSTVPVLELQGTGGCWEVCLVDEIGPKVFSRTGQSKSIGIFPSVTPQKEKRWCLGWRSYSHECITIRGLYCVHLATGIQFALSQHC